MLMFRDPVTSSKSDLGGQVTADSEEGRLEEVLAASGAEYGKDNYKRVRGRRMPRPLAGEKLQVFLYQVWKLLLNVHLDDTPGPGPLRRRHP